MNHLQGLGITQDVYSSQDVAATTAASTKGTQAAGKSASLAAAFAGDQAVLSTASTQISPVDGDVRMDKVLALQSQIAAGTYNVSASDVAEKMIGALLK